MNKTDEIIQSVGNVILGKEDIISKTLVCILAGGHILIEDVPGVGKTTMAMAFQKTLGLDYKRIQCTPDTLPSDFMGFSIYDKSSGAWTYIPGAAMCNLLLADEINRTGPKTQSALLEVMEEGRVTVDGKTREVPLPFIVMATQNPVGSTGTQPLPQSQMDRFTMRLSMGYPDRESQVSILKERKTGSPLEQVEQAISREELIGLQEAAMGVHLSDAVLCYIADLCEGTRRHELISLGLSPRGALALSRVSRAYAYLANRDFTLPEDVAAVFESVAAHRLVLHPKARLAEKTAAAILSEIVAHTRVPAEAGKR